VNCLQNKFAPHPVVQHYSVRTHFQRQCSISADHTWHLRTSNPITTSPLLHQHAQCHIQTARNIAKRPTHLTSPIPETPAGWHPLGGCHMRFCAAVPANLLQGRNACPVSLQLRGCPLTTPQPLCCPLGSSAGALPHPLAPVHVLCNPRRGHEDAWRLVKRAAAARTRPLDATATPTTATTASAPRTRLPNPRRGLRAACTPRNCHFSAGYGAVLAAAGHLTGCGSLACRQPSDLST
jgi:hypothetical protein